jgi:hypothetical protein
LGAGVEIEFRVAGPTWFAGGPPGIGNCSFIGHKEHPLKRLVLGVTEAFGGLLRFWRVMIPLGGFGLFLRGFNVGIVGYQIRVVLGVTEFFGEWFGFRSLPLGFGGLGFSSGFGRRGLRDFFSGSGVSLRCSELRT